LLTNLQNFAQKNLTIVKIFQKVLGGYFFLNHPVSPRRQSSSNVPEVYGGKDL